MTEVADIQKPFSKWLRERGLPFVQARSDQKSTIARGWPDFTICSQGSVLLIECKAAKGALSKYQFANIRRLEQAGCSVIIAHSLQECIAAVQTWIHGKDAELAPLRPGKEASKDGLYLVQWHGCPVVVNQHGRETDFVRLARPDDLLSIPRA